MILSLKALSADDTWYCSSILFQTELREEGEKNYCKASLLCSTIFIINIYN